MGWGRTPSDSSEGVGGVLLNLALLLDVQVVLLSANYHRRPVCPLGSFLGRNDRSTVPLRLKDGNVLYAGMPQTMAVQKRQLVPNAAARMLASVSSQQRSSCHLLH